MLFSGYFWSSWSLSCLCGGLCVNGRWRVLMCCVICLWMAGGKSLCLRLQHKVTQMEDPRDSRCSFPLFLFLSAAVNLISEMYQTDADRASLANTKKKIFMCLQIWTTMPQSKSSACRNLFQSFPFHSWHGRCIYFYSCFVDYLRPKLKIHFLRKASN